MTFANFDKFLCLILLLQGITVKIEESGDLTIARILAGSMSDKLGMLSLISLVVSLQALHC